MFPSSHRLAAFLLASLILGGAAGAQSPAPPVPPAAPAPAAPPAPPPTPGQLAAARELVLMTGSLSSIDALIPQFGEAVRRRQVTRPELTKDLNEVIEALKPEMELQRQQMLNEAAKVFAKYMSEPELRDTIAFFKTASGAKYLRNQPQIVDDVVNAVEVWTQQVSEYTMVRIRGEMSKRGFQMQ